MSARPLLNLSMFALASISLTQSANAQEAPPALATHFQQICGTAAEAGPDLPGSDIAAADAPGFFATDLGRAAQSRLVKIGDRYAMRALVPSSADPQHLLFLKCAVASGSTSFQETVDALSAMLSAQPRLGKTAQDFDFAQFEGGTTNFFSVYGEPNGWVSIYRMDMLMQNIDPKYLKRGARPAPAPSVR
jgi:hypothetical protein